MSEPDALTFDGSGNLYVANFSGNTTGNVTVYAAGSGTPLRTVSQGVSAPDSVAFDSAGKLYVATSRRAVAAA